MAHLNLGLKWIRQNGDSDKTNFRLMYQITTVVVCVMRSFICTQEYTIGDIHPLFERFFPWKIAVLQ